MNTLSTFKIKRSILDSVSVEMDAYLFLSGRAEPSGRISLQAEPYGPANVVFQLILRKMGGEEIRWSQEFILRREDVAKEVEVEFSIPEEALRDGGYYELLAQECGETPTLVCHLGCMAEKRRENSPSIEYFLRESLENIFAHTAVEVSVQGKAALLPACNHAIIRGYRSITYQQDSGKYYTLNFPEKPWNWQPTRLDLQLATQLEELGDALGDSKLSERFNALVELLAIHGFDERTGLGYFGEECAFDLRVMGPAGNETYPYPKFKPFNGRIDPRLPEEALWKRVGPQMARMMRSMLTGMVTDRANMDYNRFCFYNFRAESPEPAQAKSTAHCAFESSGARMILWWLDAWRETGDSVFLVWAEKMFEKWRAVQNPATGLVPNFFGAVEHSPGADQLPGGFAEARGAAMFTWLLARASGRMRKEKPDFAKALAETALRAAHGILDCMYVPGERYFREHVWLDGSPCTEGARYAFPTKEARDKAVANDPHVAKVAVFDGLGFYSRPAFWSYCAGAQIPVHLARAAGELDDDALFEKLMPLRADFAADRRTTQGAITKDGTWRFTATAYHIIFLLELANRSAGNGLAEEARMLAEEEIRDISTISCPDWWRMPERSEFIFSLHRLLKTEESQKSRE